MTTPASTQLPTASSRSRRRAVAANLIGTVLEWYDFYVFGTATALAFAPLFFPSESPLAGTLAAFATYAIGFVFRPVAGMVIARWGDTVGRKQLLVFCLVLMGVATAAIGLLPTYAEIGVIAPILLVFLRLLQSLGAGAEYGTAVTMTSEFSAPGRRGLFATVPALGVSLGVMLGTGVFGLLSLLPRADFLIWGWRLPFLFGFCLVFVGLYLRLRVDESPEFAELKRTGTVTRNPIRELLRGSRKNLALASLARSTEAVCAQLFNVFAISYCTQQLDMDAGPALTGVLLGNAVGLAVIPLTGQLADRVGRRPVFLFGLLFTAAFVFPFFWLLETREPLLVVVALTLAYGLGLKIVLAVAGAYLAEMFEPRIRNTGVNVARSISDPLGGFTPLIATALVAASGSFWPVAALVLLLALASTGAVLASPETREPADRSGGGS
ncbi:MFS transporter [Pseudonocardia endophytica]|uniref:MHS family shikimate/dehydroshikimate transporter-like MFS transporter n=1 Tax=Pseudonocardia endophytica TaxID=401976 RepID=A0A4R1HG31_PSEEN|nr:MFS transporter [Pseudonocardia endophytica]TCK21107.1 MHS family shikimate/dehydroshikimate transporter-like MFS transporter [Pseudonocardia endophytica]